VDDFKVFPGDVPDDFLAAMDMMGRILSTKAVKMEGSLFGGDMQASLRT
jgi:hypothetical protein